VRAALLTLAVLLALVGCEDEVVPTTQIVIVVDADSDLAPAIARLELVGVRGDGSLVRRELELDGSPALPLSFSLVPGIDMPEGSLTIRAFDRDGQLLGERQLGLTFATRRTLGYGVLFSVRCRDNLGLCDAEGETCVNCACGPAQVPPEALTPLRHADDVFDTWLPRLTCEPGHGADAGT
jgi:hypothetical protein